MLRSLYSGVSGMRSNQTKMDVIGSNISNVNTPGYKAGRVRFQDLFSQTLSGAQRPTSDSGGGVNPKQVGLGVSIGGIDTIMTGGAIQFTGRDLDLALEGEGFFTVSNDGGDTQMFTRDGTLITDYEGNLTTANGLSVLGYVPSSTSTNQFNVNADTIIDFETIMKGSLKPINIPGEYTFDIADKMKEKDTITIGNVVLTAVAAGTTPSANEFAVGTDPSMTANNIKKAYTAISAAEYTMDVSGTTITLKEKKASGKEVEIISNNPDAVSNFAVKTESVHQPGDKGVYSFDITNNFDSTAGAGTQTITIDNVLLTGGATAGAGVDFVIGAGTDINTTVTNIVDAYNNNGTGKYVATANGTTITLTERAVGNPPADLQDTQISHTGNLGRDTLVLNTVSGSTKGEYSFKLGGNIEPGKSITIGGVTLTEGAAKDFISGGNTDATAANIVAAYNNQSPAPSFTATVSGSTIILTEKVASDSELNVTSNNKTGGGTVVAALDPDGINNPSSTSDLDKLATLKIPKMINGHELKDFNIDGSGLISGVYGDTTYYLGRVAVSKFSNPEGLEKLGNNCYAKSNNSGEIQVGQAGKDGFAKIKQSSSELSNVELANEFTEMIVTSRAYSANSRTITTSDEMLQELLNLKR